MHRQRIYIDTSVIGGCFDEEFAEWSNLLFEEFFSGRKIAVISDVTSSELIDAPEYVKNKINEIPESNIIHLNSTDEIKELTKKYLEFKAVSSKYIDDATHIAIATVNKVDILVSWNFKHIVNYKRISMYNSVNLHQGYTLIEIRTPREVIDDETEEDF